MVWSSKARQPRAEVIQRVHTVDGETHFDTTMGRIVVPWGSIVDTPAHPRA